jgi:hypothetical protein
MITEVTRKLLEDPGGSSNSLDNLGHSSCIQEAPADFSIPSQDVGGTTTL